MYRIIGGILVLLLALPAAGVEDKLKDKAKDKPATPAEQYQALLQEHQKAMNAYRDAVQNAKTPEEQQKTFQEKYPKPEQFAPRFVALAEKNPKDPIAVDALIWAMTNSFGSSGESGPQAKAIDLLIRNHIQSAKLGRMCPSLAFQSDKGTETLLRAVLEKNPHKDVQAEACLALAQSLGRRAAIAKHNRNDPNAAKAGAESVRFFKELADKHLAQLTPERLTQVCQQLAFSEDKGSESLVRTLLEKDKRREVQGVACLTLAQILKQRADGMAAAEAKPAEKVRGESEKLFERAADQYADVKLPFYGTVGAKAKSELFDLHHLSVGKLAPDIEGEDQDGKKFKLSDYAGKVVLLDFWSRF